MTKRAPSSLPRGRRRLSNLVPGTDTRRAAVTVAPPVHVPVAPSSLGHGHYDAVAFGHGHLGPSHVAPSALRSPGPVWRIAGTALPRLVVLPRALNLVLEGTPVGGPVVGHVHMLLATRGAVPSILVTPVPAMCLQALDGAAAHPNARAPNGCAPPAHADLAVLLGGGHRFPQLRQACVVGKPHWDSTYNRLLSHHGYGG